MICILRVQNLVTIWKSTDWLNPVNADRLLLFVVRRSLKIGFNNVV